MFNVAVEKDLIRLQGYLSEDTNMNAVEEGVVRARLQAPENMIRADLSGVTRANSTGIFRWCRMIQTLDVKLRYVEAPIWLVHQFNYVDEFLADGHQVESIQAEFLCPEDETYEIRVLNIGRDVPILSTYETFEFKIRNNRNAKLVPTFDTASYLSFIPKIRRTS